MKKEQVTLLIGLIGCALLSLILFLIGTDFYNIASVAVGELFATTMIMKAMTRENSESSFLIAGVLSISLFMILALVIVAIILPLASLFMVLIYLVAISAYILMFFFAKRINQKNGTANTNIAELQQCLELIDIIRAATNDKKTLLKLESMKDELRSLDLSRDFDLMGIAHQLMQYMRDQESQDKKNSLDDIELIISQYSSLSKQAKMGKV